MTVNGLKLARDGSLMLAGRKLTVHVIVSRNPFKKKLMDPEHGCCDPVLGRECQATCVLSAST